MNSKYVKNLTTYVTLALIIASVFAVIPITLLPKVEAQAQGTITLSSSNLHPYKVVEITVNIPGFTYDWIELTVTDQYGEPIPLMTTWGSTEGSLWAASVSPGVYVAYLGGEEVNIDSNPRYPRPTWAGRGNVARLDKSLSAGSTINIGIPGLGITTTVTYNTVKPTSISLDRTEVPSRRTSEYVVRLTLEDQDLNLDPTAVDDLSSFPIVIDVTWISGTTGETKTTTVVKSGSDIRESAVNSGKFTVPLTVAELTPEDATLSKGDIFLLTAYSNIEWGADNTKYLTARLDVVYRYPEISIDFTQQGVTISIKSPDDNVRTYAKDTLESGKTVEVSFAGKTCYIDASKFKETGSNTAVFTYSIPVEWGTTSDLPTDCSKVVLGLDKASFTLSATYLDITGSGTYTTAKPEVTVVKQSPVSVILLVKDKDINVDPNSIDRLTPYVDAVNDVIYLKMGDLKIYEIKVKGADGTYVDIPSGYPTTGSITFFETDFDSGEFRLTLPSPGLFVAGESYTIEITDHTGKYAVSVPVTIIAVSIELDRSEYPAALGDSIVVYVTYSNDIYNTDPTKIDSVTVSVKIVGNDGTTELYSDTITLKETGVDTGVFTGSKSITIPSDTRDSNVLAVEGKIVVSDPGYTGAKAEAKLKIYDGSLKVEPTVVKMGDSITITLEDKDLNKDSGVAEEYTMSILYSSKCGSMPVKLKETGPNTGVFKATLNIGREEMFPACLSAPDTFTITYNDLREMKLIVGYGTYSVALQSKVTLASTTGALDVVTAEEGYIGLKEKFKIVVKDIDLNLQLEDIDRAEVYVVVEGIKELEISPAKITLLETDVSTGVFSKSLKLTDIPGMPTDLKELAKFVGKKVIIMYRDVADETGTVSVVQKILTIKAYEPYLTTTPKDFVNVGEEITVSITDKNIVGAGTVSISVKSTSYPVPITIYAEEVLIDDKPTGVFTASIKVVDLAAWIAGAPQVPAKLGDTITITYIAPVNSAGQTDVPITTSLVVGRYAPIPIKTEKVETLDEAGNPVTPSVGKLTFVSIAVKNTDIISRDMTVLVVVRDPEGVAVAMFYTTLTLAPGESRAQGFGWIPAKAGVYSVEVYVVKSLADRTVLAEPYTQSVEVVSR